MGLILPPAGPHIDWQKAQKARDLIGNTLYDYEEFKPLIEMALSDRLADLEAYCVESGQDYNDKLRRQFEIVEIEVGYYTAIIPHFMLMDIYKRGEYYVMWCRMVEEIENQP